MSYYSLSNEEKLKIALDEMKEDFPELHKVAVKIVNKTEIFADGLYTSRDTDSSSWNYHDYFQAKNNEITAIGHERGREGGWVWFKE